MNRKRRRGEKEEESRGGGREKRGKQGEKGEVINSFSEVNVAQSLVLFERLGVR